MGKMAGTMATLEYQDLDLDQVDRMLSQNGELLVSLPERHASACIALIEMVRAAKSWSSNRAPVLVRVWRLLKGFLVVLRVLIAHRRLLELSRVVILHTSVQTWEQTADGNFLFRFVR